VLRIAKIARSLTPARVAQQDGREPVLCSELNEAAAAIRCDQVARLAHATHRRREMEDEMPWSSTVVTREKLFDEVWAEPVVKVARRYGVSDVALRKVCVKLSVPMPPVGHWAKRAHGKPTVRPGLPPRSTAEQHVFRQWVTPIDDELQERLATAHADAAAAHPAQPRPDIALQTQRSSWHQSVRRAATGLRNEFPRLAESWQIAKGGGHFSIYVSKASAERALSLLDLLVRLCIHEGLEVASDGEENVPARVRVHGYAFTFRVVERAIRHERDITAAERQALYNDKGPFIANRVTKQGTGHLRLEVLNTGDYAILTRSDTHHQRLDEVIYEVPAALRRYAVEQAVRDVLAKERAERAQAESRRRQALIDIKKAELRRLEEIEKAAEQWQRAQRLDHYAQALSTAAQTGDLTADARARLLEDAQWTQRAAAWLNPLVRRHWPQVDDAPSSPYVYGS
jgi:hypothetical protein